MANWEGSNRRAELPCDWLKIREAVGDRDSWSCQWDMGNGTMCLETANQCDHIQHGGSDDEENLRMLCAKHHHLKSSREGREGRTESRKRKLEWLRHPEETNAGELAVPVAPLKHKGF